MRILLVEDEPTAAQFVAMILDLMLFAKDGLTRKLDKGDEPSLTRTRRGQDYQLL